jgi:hypothetical protein
MWRELKSAVSKLLLRFSTTIQLETYFVAVSPTVLIKVATSTLTSL